MPELELSVSATTREPRQGEGTAATTTSSTARSSTAAPGDGEFLEHATYSGNRYGTLRSEVERRLDAGQLGGARDRGPGRAPGPGGDAGGGAGVHRASEPRRRCGERLEGRGTDSTDEIDERLRTAELELAAQEEFQHVVVNDEIERAAERAGTDRARRARPRALT